MFDKVGKVLDWIDHDNEVKAIARFGVFVIAAVGVFIAVMAALLQAVSAAPAAFTIGAGSTLALRFLVWTVRD